MAENDEVDEINEIEPDPNKDYEERQIVFNILGEESDLEFIRARLYAALEEKLEDLKEEGHLDHPEGLTLWWEWVDAEA